MPSRSCRARLLGGLERSFRQQDHKFVAAVAAGDVFFAHALLQECAQLAQEGIAGFVAVGVVESLEAVHVQQHDGQLPLPARRAADFAVQDFVQIAPIVEAGERIADGLQAQAFAQPQIGQRQRDVAGDGDRQLLARDRRIAVWTAPDSTGSTAGRRNSSTPRDSPCAIMGTHRELAGHGLVAPVRADDVHARVGDGVQLPVPQRPAVAAVEHLLGRRRGAPRADRLDQVQRSRSARTPHRNRRGIVFSANWRMTAPISSSLREVCSRWLI